jgi:hypothetical protein
MPFAIDQPVFDPKSGEYLEEVALHYREDLEALFEASVEGKMLEQEGILPGWVDSLLDLGIGYLEVTPAQMSAADVRTILFELIPRKISAPADEVPAALRELELFWTFLQREFHLPNAAACLKVLREKGTALRMRAAMTNPANFGIAKSFVMLGMQRGFDMTSEAGINEWMATYNAELRAGTGTPVPLPALPGMSVPRGTGRRKTQAGKAKRKVAKSSRKQNRPKK